MRIFITGITGFVGSHLAEHLVAQGHEIHGLCRWRSSLNNLSNIENKIQLHHGDLCDFISISNTIKNVKPEIVFHLAAQSFVPFSFQAPAVTLDTNVTGTCNLFEAIRLFNSVEKSIKIVMSTSSEVYGQVNQNELPIKEDTPFRPASPYAVSKVAQDLLGYQYHLSYGLDIVRCRLFTHTGPRQHEGLVTSNFAKQIARIEKGLQEPPIFVGNLDSVRTFMDVKDAVQAYWLLTDCPAGEVYNIGGNITMTILELLNKMISLSTVKNIKYREDPAKLRPSDVTLQIPSTKKFFNQTGWKPIINFDQTLIDILNYWRDKVGS